MPAHDWTNFMIGLYPPEKLFISFCMACEHSELLGNLRRKTGAVVDGSPELVEEKSGIRGVSELEDCVCVML